MTSEEARDEMFTMLQDEWTARAIAYGPGDPAVLPKIYWQGKEYEAPPPQEFPYARASLHHLNGSQSSFGATGGRLFDRSGIIVVQCFGPNGSGKGLTISEGLATIAKEAYEGRSSSGGIWFRNCHITEIGSDNGFYQVNAQVGFSYSEVK